jgi:threonine dehydratase
MGCTFMSTKPPIPDVAAVHAAAGRIAGRVRRTPQIAVEPTRRRADCHLWLKLECLQVTGSFKPRGAFNTVLQLPEAKLSRGIVTASGGNHGLGVAYVGRAAGRATRIYIPSTVPIAKRKKLTAWGAELVLAGDVWDEANQAALGDALDTGAAYVHPFADPSGIAGQGTLALEILDDLPDVETLIVAIGGGGLISGVALVAKALRPGIRVIGVEPTGAPTLYESLRAKRVVELKQVDTAAGTLAPRSSEPINFEIISGKVDKIVLVTDEDMREAARWLWFELGIAAELSGAAAVAALLCGSYKPRPDERVCAVVCGAGTDGMD